MAGWTHPCSPYTCACDLAVRAPHTHILLVPFPEVTTQGLAVISPFLSQQGTEGMRKQNVFELHTKMFPAAGHKLCELMKLKNRAGVRFPSPFLSSQLSKGCSGSGCLLIQAQPGSGKKTLSGDFIFMNRCQSSRQPRPAGVNKHLWGCPASSRTSHEWLLWPKAVLQAKQTALGWNSPT